MDVARGPLCDAAPAIFAQWSLSSRYYLAIFKLFLRNSCPLYAR
jgi:hypothetical protein